MITTQKMAILAAMTITLFGCKGSEDKSTNEGPFEIKSYIESSNLVSQKFPWHVLNHPSGLAQGKLKRWKYESSNLIPVKLNGSTLAISAIDKIEEKLKKQIFDRTSIASIPDDQIVRGLIVSEGTAVAPSGPGCDHVGQAPSDTNYPTYIYSETDAMFYPFYSEDGEISTKLYINLSSSSCSPSLDVAIHEFGHALGVGEHFNGFGNGPPISDNFWKVLSTIYGNPIGAMSSDISVIMSL